MFCEQGLRFWREWGDYYGSAPFFISADKMKERLNGYVNDAGFAASIRGKGKAVSDYGRVSRFDGFFLSRKQTPRNPAPEDRLSCTKGVVVQSRSRAAAEDVTPSASGRCC